MPPRLLLPSASGWKCPQCTTRSFSSSVQQLAVGPEHPRYIEVPEPPQQTVPDRPPIKGVLPVPRDIFAGIDRTRSIDDILTTSTRDPKIHRTPAKGSREEWKAKMSEIRKQNLREGVKSLRARQETEQRKAKARAEARRRERDELLNRPEREDERLTAPSNNLDLEALLGKQVPDPDRDARLQRKKENVERVANEKRQERLDALHSLYMNARDFIVTPQQLDQAVDEAFGTVENPVRFGTAFSGTTSSGMSPWVEGRPPRVQDLVNRANRQLPRTAIDAAGGYGDINKDRIRRIAEALTGGRMDEAER